MSCPLHLQSMNILTLLLAAALYHAEPTNGTVNFTIMKWGVMKEEGTFREFRAEILFDRENAAKSRVAFDVNVASIDTKNDTRDETLRSADFFDARKHPKMTFRSTRVVSRAKDAVDVTGDLTIRGVTRRITVPVKLIGVSADGKRAGFETEFRIDRRAFGVNGTRWSEYAPGVLGDEVTIRIVAGGVTR